MRTLKLNQLGDLEFDSRNNLKMTEGLEEIRQRLRITLSTNNGEWFLNTNFGVPWFEMLSTNAGIERFRKEVIKVLNRDAGVDEILSVKLDFDTEKRNLQIDFRIRIDKEVISESVVI